MKIPLFFLTVTLTVLISAGEVAHSKGTRTLLFPPERSLSPSDQTQSQDKDNIIKSVADSLFYDYVNRGGIKYKDAYYQILNDSLAVITLTVTGQETRIINASIPVIFFVVGQRQGSREFKYVCLSHERSDSNSNQLFYALEHPYFSKNMMQNSEHRCALYSSKTYEDALYHRFMSYLALWSVKYGGRGDYNAPFITKEWLESYFHTIKTGLWVCKNELDDFGDPVGISLSCPFYAKRMKNGAIEKEDREFFLSISSDAIRFIPGPYEYISSFDTYTLTVKDASGNLLTCSLDNNLKITSNASSFLRFIERGGIIKGNIKQEKGDISYAFTIYTNGYNAAKSSLQIKEGFSSSESHVSTQQTSVHSPNQTRSTIPSWVFEYDWKIVANEEVSVLYHLDPPTNSGKNHYVVIVSLGNQQSTAESSYSYSDGEFIMSPPAGSDTVVRLVLENSNKYLLYDGIKICQRVVRKNYTNH